MRIASWVGMFLIGLLVLAPSLSRAQRVPFDDARSTAQAAPHAAVAAPSASSPLSLTLRVGGEILGATVGAAAGLGLGLGALAAFGTFDSSDCDLVACGPDVFAIVFIGLPLTIGGPILGSATGAYLGGESLGGDSRFGKVLGATALGALGQGLVLLFALELEIDEDAVPALIALSFVPTIAGSVLGYALNDRNARIEPVLSASADHAYAGARIVF